MAAMVEHGHATVQGQLNVEGINAEVDDAEQIGFCVPGHNQPFAGDEFHTKPYIFKQPEQVQHILKNFLEEI